MSLLHEFYSRRLFLNVYYLLIYRYVQHIFPKSWQNSIFQKLLRRSVLFIALYALPAISHHCLVKMTQKNRNSKFHIIALCNFHLCNCLLPVYPELGATSNPPVRHFDVWLCCCQTLAPATDESFTCCRRCSEYV